MGRALLGSFPTVTVPAFAVADRPKPAKRTSEATRIRMDKLRMWELPKVSISNHPPSGPPCQVFSMESHFVSIAYQQLGENRAEMTGSGPQSTQECGCNNFGHG